MITVQLDERGVKGFNREVERLLKKVNDKETKKIMTVAAKPYINTVRVNAPKATKNVHRYDTPKLNGKLKAPKGSGVIAATYTPGNLGRSFKKLALRLVRGAIVIGPKRAKRATKGTFAGNRVDGWYAHFREFGTKNMKGTGYAGRSWRQSVGSVKRNIERGLKTLIER